MTRKEEIELAASCHMAASNEVFKEYYEGFIAGAEWADKTQIERVLKFIFEYFYEHPHVNCYICTDSFESLEELEEELKEAMKE